MEMILIQLQTKRGGPEDVYLFLISYGIYLHNVPLRTSKIFLKVGNLVSLLEMINALAQEMNTTLFLTVKERRLRMHQL